MTVRQWLKQVAIAWDQLGNAILKGYADETLSARAYRNQSKRRWRVVRMLIDGVFSLFGADDHCMLAYLGEKKRAQMPKEYRDA